MKRKVEGAYFYAWGELRKLMRSHGVPSKECDARRHEIHVEALGYDKSHKKFTNPETDEVLKRFRELAGVISLTDYERGRRLYVIRRICDDLGKSEEYAQGIADQMQRDGIRRAPGQTQGEFEIAKWESELNREGSKRRLLHELTPTELDAVIIALREHKRRGGGTVAEPAKPQRVGHLEPACRNVPTSTCLHAQTGSVAVHTEEEPF